MGTTNRDCTPRIGCHDAPIRTLPVHELLTTFLAEATTIVNARPITLIPTETDDLQPLTPAMLLTMKTKPLFPPPGVFVRHDLYSKRYWRRAQYLADQFWVRWRSEYLQTLQVRSKWNKCAPNLEPHDIVLMKDEAHRNINGRWEESWRP